MGVEAELLCANHPHLAAGHNWKEWGSQKKGLVKLPDGGQFLFFPPAAPQHCATAPLPCLLVVSLSLPLSRCPCCRASHALRCCTAAICSVCSTALHHCPASSWSPPLSPCPGGARAAVPNAAVLQSITCSALLHHPLHRCNMLSAPQHCTAPLPCLLVVSLSVYPCSFPISLSIALPKGNTLVPATALRPIFLLRTTRSPLVMLTATTVMLAKSPRRATHAVVVSARQMGLTRSSDTCRSHAHLSSMGMCY